MAKAKHDWNTLDPLIDNFKAQGWNDTQIAKDLGIGRQTLVDHLRLRDPGTPIAHPSTPDHVEGRDPQLDLPDVVHQGTPEDAISTEVHPSTPEVHQNMSEGDSGVPAEYSSVPARQSWPAEVPAVHPGTPTAEDWQLWHTIKARWQEVEKMLADRQALQSTPLGTPGHTQKKTYVFATKHVALIDAYAQDHRLELKDVIYLMCEEFFQRR